MRKIFFLVYFFFALLAGLGLSYAQEYPGGGNVAQWRLTFDVIKAKVAGLLEENNRLTQEKQSYDDSLKSISQEIDGQSSKNTSMQQLLNERRGKTDQQVRIEQLEAQLKLKKVQSAARQAKALEFKSQLEDLKRTVELKKLKVADLELHQNMPSASNAVALRVASGDVELDALRKELEDQKAEEAKLEDQLSSMTKAAHHPEIALLKQKADFLRKQKMELLKTQSQPLVTANNAPIDRNVYYTALQQKTQLEEKIRQFEIKINALKNMPSVKNDWPAQKKKLVHQIVQNDARNHQLREKINSIREDIGLLKDQVASLEKKVNFSKAKSTTFNR